MDQERNQAYEVDEARKRIAEDVRSVERNANVVERAKETAQGRVDGLKHTVGERVRQVRDQLQDARSRMQQMKPAQNPIGMLVGGLAIGFLAGMIASMRRRRQ